MQGLSRRFDGEGSFALRDVSFSVQDGRVAALLGPSGCGKTSVLRLIAGLDRPDGGEVTIDGEPVLALPPHRRGVGLMFQELALFPHLDVTGNIEFGLRMAKWPKVARRARIDQLLDLIGLAGFGRRRVHELSGGERQRVALARTLAPEPAVLLLDEPLGSLDEQLKHELRAQLREVLTRLHTTALIVSHDLRDAVAIADDIIVMEGGAVLQDGAIQDVLAGPSSAAVALMLGYVTLAEGTVAGGRVVEEAVGAVPLPEGLTLDGQAQVLAHPSSLLAVPAGAGLGCGVEGTVLASRPDGPTQMLDVSLGERRTARVRWEWDLLPPQDGATVELATRPGTLRFFRMPEEVAEAWAAAAHGEAEGEADRGEDGDGDHGGGGDSDSALSARDGGPAERDGDEPDEAASAGEPPTA